MVSNARCAYGFGSEIAQREKQIAPNDKGVGSNMRIGMPSEFIETKRIEPHARHVAENFAKVDRTMNAGIRIAAIGHSKAWIAIVKWRPQTFETA